MPLSAWIKPKLPSDRVLMSKQMVVVVCAFHFQEEFLHFEWDNQSMRVFSVSKSVFRCYLIKDKLCQNSSFRFG